MKPDFEVVTTDFTDCTDERGVFLVKERFVQVRSGATLHPCHPYYNDETLRTAGKNLECGDLSPLLPLWRLVAKAGPRSAARESWTPSRIRRRQVACGKRGQVRALQSGCGSAALYYNDETLRTAGKNLECGDLSKLLPLWRLVAKAGPRSAARERWTPSRIRRRQVACGKRGRVRALQSGCGFAALDYNDETSRTAGLNLE